MTTSKIKPSATQIKRRTLMEQELKPLLLDRVGTARINIRTDEVTLGNLVLNADEIERFYLELCSPTEKWIKTQTTDAIWSMALSNKFDPVVDYLVGLDDHQPLPMEQWERLDNWLLGIDNCVAAEFLPQYLIGAVARALKPGSEARCTPVLVGPQQRGKTTMGRILYGQDYWVEGLQDFSRDSRMRCQTAWGVELSELDGITRRADVESLKTFLTEMEDTFRKPYGKAPIKTPRNFVFWGTANGSPLRDLSGNSRFLCIGLPDQMLPLDWTIANRNALWARAVEQYRKGVDWKIISEEQRQQRIEANTNYQEIDPWGEIINTLLAYETNNFITYEQIYQKLEVSREKQNTANARRIKQLVESMKWEYAQRRQKGVVMRGFWRQQAPVKVQGGELF